LFINWHFIRCLWCFSAIAAKRINFHSLESIIRCSVGRVYDCYYCRVLAWFIRMMLSRAQPHVIASATTRHRERNHTSSRTKPQVIASAAWRSTAELNSLLDYVSLEKLQSNARQSEYSKIWKRLSYVFNGIRQS